MEAHYLWDPLPTEWTQVEGPNDVRAPTPGERTNTVEQQTSSLQFDETSDRNQPNLDAPSVLKPAHICPVRSDKKKPVFAITLYHRTEEKDNVGEATPIRIENLE
jgi:hypothetical protein